MNPFSLKQHLSVNRRLDYLENVEGKTPQDLLPEYIDNNVLNLELDTPIYRIFNAQRFYEMLENRQLMLVRPRCWEDPFENFLLSARWELEDGTIINAASIRDRYYGQCWTMRKECDGLWRNYRGERPDPEAPYPPAFKVATTVRKLMGQFYDPTVPGHTLTFFVGKVEYRSDEEIKAYFSEPEKMNTSEQMANIRYPQTLLVKRQAFSYEEEVRMIYSENRSGTSPAPPAGSPLHPVAIDPDALFDFVELDPWMTVIDRWQAEERIRAAGFTGSVTQSSLYNSPDFVVRVARG
ncbi:MAG: hypothetical protein ACRYFX_17835 [Janthinobacterium lividum]